MINELTPEQEVIKEQWIKDWFKIGASTDPADRPMAEEAISGLYQWIKKSPPKFIWVESPFAAANLLKENGKSADVKKMVAGQENAYWVNFYLFCSKIMGAKIKKDDATKLHYWEMIVRSCSWWWPFEKIAVVSNRPELISWNANKVLHNATGPSVRFRDGWSIYSLNGIRMEPWHVETPAEKIDPVAILKEKNVDRRRELIRKVGIERLIGNLPHRILDTQGDYSLLSVDLSDTLKDCRYLKMLNPSIKIWHVEGVERTDPATVQEALNWRASKILKTGESWKPSQLT
jgi:hypothetical protein